MCLGSCSNTFGFMFEPIWLFVRTRFGFSFEHGRLFVRTHFIQQSNASRPWSERVHKRSKGTWQKMCYTLCLTGTVYDVPALINLIISSLSSIVNTTFLRLNFSVILRASLKSYSINNVTTVHAQRSQGCVQIIEGSYNRVFDNPGCTVVNISSDSCS